MKKTVLGLIIIGMLAGCSTVENKPAPIDTSQADAEAAKAAADKAAADKTAADAAAQARALAQSRLASQLNPLTDPNNILSQRSVYFDFNQYSVSDVYHAMLEAHAAYLVAHSNAKVTLQGNTDDRGSSEYNLALGQRRADAVRKELSLLSVPEKQMEAISFGKEKPRATGDDEAAWKQDRRTDIVYQGE